MHEPGAMDDQDPVDQQAAQQAADRLLARAQTLPTATFDWATCKSDRDHGRP